MPLQSHPSNLTTHLLPDLPVRSSDSHKGMFGHGLLVGGMSGMLGAIVLAGQSCLRSGAGLTTLAVPDAAQIGLGLTLPCAMSVGLPSLERYTDSIGAGHDLWYDLLSQPKFHLATLAIGPGLGRHPATDKLVQRCWREWANAAVFDADALNALAESPTSGTPLPTQNLHLPTQNSHPHDSEPHSSEMREEIDLGDHVAPRIITPHPGEWERLSGISRKDRPAQMEAARQLARQWNVIIVLKGSKSFITNGRSEYTNSTGNPSMSVGGSGDCLTGIITALLCQGLSPLDAAILGTHLHGLAGDLAHAHLGSPSTLPTDLIDFLPEAFRALRSTEDCANAPD